MRLNRQYIRYIRDGFKNIWNNIFMSISSVLTLTITLSLCAAVMLLADNTNQFTRQIENEVTIFAEFRGNITLREIHQALQQIDAHPGVQSREFRTADEELREAIELIAAGDPYVEYALVSSTEDNPMRNVVDVEANSIEEVQEVRRFLLEEVEAIDFVADQQTAIDALINLTTTVRRVMIVGVFLLLFLAIFLIQNTIKLTIYARREELKIMKLVGASIPYITIPFIIEGALIGLLGAAVPILTTILGYRILFDTVEGIFAVPLLQMSNPDPLVYQIGTTAALISIGVSLLGSLLAVGKYALRND